MASRVSIFFLALAFSLLASSGAEVSDSEGDGGVPSQEFVLTLHHANFSDTVSKHSFVVVEFYAPWCGHCKQLAPEYEKAASILTSNDPPLVLAKVDADDELNEELASKYKVESFPTIKIFRNGGTGVQDYKGPRDAEGIVAYLKKQVGPASKEIKSIEDASNLIGDNNVIVVGVFPKFAGEEFEIFITAAEKLRSECDFGHTLDAKLLPRGETLVAGPAIRLFKPFDELFVDSKDFHVDAIEKFVEESGVPLVTTFNKDPNNFRFLEKVFQSPDAQAMLFLNFSSELVDAFKTSYHYVAEQYKGKGLKFIMADLDAAQNLFLYYGFKVEQVPLIIILSSNDQKYLKTNLKPDHIAPWIKEYKDGYLLPFIKSERIPEVNNDPVKVVVADNLQDIVFNSGKNVLLNFYAPWCKYCKMLAPILDEVAASYENDPEVVIAQFDAIANDYPKSVFDVKLYPTLYFNSASGKLVKYDEDKTKHLIIDFIENNRDNTTRQVSRKDEL